MATAMASVLAVCGFFACASALSQRRTTAVLARPGLPKVGDFAGGSFTTLGHAHVLPSLALLKTHKTGSSTLANILHRLGDRRNMTFMVPTDNVHLGWPREFPGDDEIEKYGPPRHQFDIIANHGVFDSAGYRGYLRGEPHFIVVVRDPMTQATSAKDYFHLKNTPWDDYLQWLEQIDPVKDFHACGETRHGTTAVCDTQVAHFLNPQAHDLGWHDFARRTRASETDRASIDEWLHTLDGDLKPTRSVILAEYFDEGLVLMRQALRCDLEELSYFRMKVKKHHKMKPTTSQLQRLADVNRVDVALYKHFNKTFWKEWGASDQATLDKDLAELRNMNSNLVVACDEFDWDREGCPPEFVTDEVKYGVALKKKQKGWGLALDE